jgi:hypothetical protein
MNARMILAFFFCTAIAAAAAGQSPQNKDPQGKNFPTTLQPVNPVKYYGPKKSKKKKKSTVTYDAQNEYYDRVETTWRQREKRERTLDRGEATDYMKPPYFGHKKPPKIRPLEKRKYCKICGIRH